MLITEVDALVQWAALEQDASVASVGELASAIAADDQGALAQALREAAAKKEPWFERASSQGWTFRLSKLDEPRMTRRIVSAFEEALVRPTRALAPNAKRLVAIAPMGQPGLEFRPIHRAVSHVEGFAPDRFLTLIREFAREYPVEGSLLAPDGLSLAVDQLAQLSAQNHAFLYVMPGGEARILRFRQALGLSQFKAAPKSPTLRSLDLALLNALVLRTTLGIQSPEAPGHPKVFTEVDLPTLVRKVDQGVYQAGFALNPPPQWEIRAVMEAQQTLPPNTMLVEPLPPSDFLPVASEK
jgi:hypothetical protein